MIDIQSMLKPPTYLDSLNNVISSELCSKILYNALVKKVLILTRDEEEATGICYCVKTYVASKMSDKIKVKISKEGIEVGAAYGFIQCMSLETWQSEQRADFEGLLLVTDKTFRRCIFLKSRILNICRQKTKEDKDDHQG